MRPFRHLLLIATLSLLVTSSAFGAGYSLFEQGAKATGMGGAFAATADDPSAMFYNVAGIAFQRKTAVMTGATWITFNAEFESDPLSEFPGGNVNSPVPGVGYREFYADHNFVLPNMYVVIPIGENATFGVGQFTPFGLRTDWLNKGTTFTGRFISQDANLKTVSVQPSFAMKTTDGRFAWGVGVDLRAGRVSLAKNIPAFSPFSNRIVDVAHVQLLSDDKTDIGWNVGIIWAPSDGWRIGLSHRAKQDIEFTGDADFTAIATGNAQFDAIVAAGLPPDQKVNLTLPFPSFTHFGIATTKIPNWTVELDVVRMDWSRFESLDVAFVTTPASNLHVEENWKDVYSYRIGANRTVNDTWDVRMGAVYDQNPQPTPAVGPILPDSDRAGVSFGVGYRHGPWTIDITEFYLQFKSRSTEGRSQDNYNGTYETQANLLSFNLGYTF